MTKPPKLVEVPVARYGFRHEAEFAAGFLDDAGIPYRLQLDDPALGTSLAMQATIWVLEPDVERVRELLELDDRGRGLSLTSRPESRGTPPVRRERADVAWPRLATRERFLGGALGIALGASSTSLASVAFGPEAAAIGGVGLVGAALFGRAPRWLRSMLAALTGGEP